jgi:hypothetical protein
MHHLSSRDVIRKLGASSIPANSRGALRRTISKRKTAPPPDHAVTRDAQPGPIALTVQGRPSAAGPGPGSGGGIQIVRAAMGVGAYHSCARRVSIAVQKLNKELAEMTARRVYVKVGGRGHGRGNVCVILLSLIGPECCKRRFIRFCVAGSELKDRI